MVKSDPVGKQADFMYSAAAESTLPFNVLNGFKTGAESEAQQRQAQSEQDLRSKELISKLEQPGSAYQKNKTFTVTDGGVFLRKGEEMGMFELGSTIVLLFECPPDKEVLHQAGDKLQVGQRITN